jgi:polyisoprenoid-binding protein YceI
VTSDDPISSDLSVYAGSWTIDQNQSTAEFRTKALWVLPVKGKIAVIGGGASVDSSGRLTGSLEFSAASINTKNKKRDDHLRTADFFEVVKYPTIGYEVTEGRVLNSGQLELRGSLTVHGQTRPLTVLADVSSSGNSVVLSTEVDIDRRSWGLLLAPFGAGFNNRVAVNVTFRKA